MAKKFTHEIAYRGEGLIDRLKGVRIVVCGAGALGSNLVETLIRQGVSDICVIDMDRVDEHNVNTQVYGDNDVGALKVTALQNRIWRDVGVEIDVVNKKLEEKNVKKLLKGAKLVIDAFDNSEARQVLHDYCSKNKIDCLHSGLFEDYGEVVWDSVYQVPANSEDGDVCDYPLARNIVMLVVTVVAEEVLDYVLSDNPRWKSWSVTLKDFAVRSYK